MPNPAAEERHEEQQDEDHQADHRQAVVEEAVEDHPALRTGLDRKLAIRRALAPGRGCVADGAGPG